MKVVLGCEIFLSSGGDYLKSAYWQITRCWDLNYGLGNGRLA